VPADDPHGGDAPQDGAEPERREERARHLGARVLVVREHGEARAEHLAEPVRDERRGPEDAQQRVANEKADAREDAPTVVGLRKRRPRRHEQREKREGAEEGRGVDVEHDRRAEHRDQEACGGRAEQGHGPIRPLDDGIRLRHDVLVLTDQLGQDQALRREVRREEDPDRGDDREEQRKGQPAELVEHWDRREQRRADEVRDDHGAPRAVPRDHGAGRDPEDRNR
jgi:hypothetical protein